MQAENPGRKKKTCHSPKRTRTQAQSKSPNNQLVHVPAGRRSGNPIGPSEKAHVLTMGSSARVDEEPRLVGVCAVESHSATSAMVSGPLLSRSLVFFAVAVGGGAGLVGRSVGGGVQAQQAYRALVLFVPAKKGPFGAVLLTVPKMLRRRAATSLRRQRRNV